MITPVCQSFGVFPSSTPPDTPLSTNVLLLRSMPITFRSDFVFTSSLSAFQSSNDYCHFCQCEDFLISKINRNEVYKSSKYSLICERISLSSQRLYSVESLMEVVVLKRFSRNRQIVYQDIVNVCSLTVFSYTRFYVYFIHSIGPC